MWTNKHRVGLIQNKQQIKVWRAQTKTIKTRKKQHIKSKKKEPDVTHVTNDDRIIWFKFKALEVTSLWSPCKYRIWPCLCTLSTILPASKNNNRPWSDWLLSKRLIIKRVLFVVVSLIEKRHKQDQHKLLITKNRTHHKVVDRSSVGENSTIKATKVTVKFFLPDGSAWKFVSPKALFLQERTAVWIRKYSPSHTTS